VRKDKDESAGATKSARKREALGVQDLGEALLELPDGQLDALVTDERLRDALRDLRRFTSHGARYRQAQFVGKLMREVDIEPLQRALDTKRSRQTADAAAFRKVEQWRTRLLAGDEGLSAWLAQHPGSDTPDFRALVREARRDDRGPAFRELFRAIRAALG